MTYEEWWNRNSCDICAKDGKPVGPFMIEKYGNPVSKAAWDAAVSEMNESLQVERTHVCRLVAENARLERELAEARGNNQMLRNLVTQLQEQVGKWEVHA
jgi:hypothetical protein